MARVNRGSSAIDLITGISLGAAAMYALDPDRGRRRRAVARDKATRVIHDLRDVADKGSRDLVNRTKGTFYEAWASMRGKNVPDDILEQRVRSKLGRVVSHPRSIEVHADDGVVRLSGPVLEAEADRLVNSVYRVRGVHEVRDELERHKEAGDVPGLQGGAGRPGETFELMQRNWSPATRFLVGGTGVWLAMMGIRRRGVLGWPLFAAGSALLTRSSANVPAAQLAGLTGRRTIDFQKDINIHAPVDEVFKFWANFENFPKFMLHVREVTKISENRFRWTVTGPAGAPVSWVAQVTEFVPNQVIAWRSEEGSAVGNAGLVRFQQNGDSTRLTVRMSYSPPGGAIGHAFASLFGTDPKHAMNDDLARFKSLLEVGKTTGNQHQVRKEKLAI